MSPVSTPGAWQERGGRYKYKAKGLAYSAVLIGDNVNTRTKKISLIALEEVFQQYI